jgi:hypothetical protein
MDILEQLEEGKWYHIRIGIYKVQKGDAVVNELIIEEQGEPEH